MHTLKFSIAPNYTLYGFRQEYTLQDDGQNCTIFGLKSTIFRRCFHKQREGASEQHHIEITTYCLKV